MFRDTLATRADDHSFRTAAHLELQNELGRSRAGTFGNSSVLGELFAPTCLLLSRLIYSMSVRQRNGKKLQGFSAECRPGATLLM